MGPFITHELGFVVQLTNKGYNYQRKSEMRNDYIQIVWNSTGLQHKYSNLDPQFTINNTWIMKILLFHKLDKALYLSSL